MFNRAISVFLLVLAFGVMAPATFAADDDGNGRSYVETSQDVAADKAFEQQAEGPATFAQNGPIQVTPTPVQGAGAANKSDGTVVSRSSGETSDMYFSPEVKARLDALTVLEKRLLAGARNSTKKRSVARTHTTKSVVATNPAPTANPAAPAADPAAPAADPATASPVQGGVDLSALAADVAAIKADIVAHKGVTDATALKIDGIALTLANLQPAAVGLTPEQVQEIKDAASSAVSAKMAEISWYSKWGFWLSIVAIILIIIGMVLTFIWTRRPNADESGSDGVTNQQVLEEIRAMSGRVGRVETIVVDAERFIRGDIAGVASQVKAVDDKLEDVGNSVLELAVQVRDVKTEVAGLGSQFGDLRSEFKLLAAKIADVE